MFVIQSEIIGYVKKVISKYNLEWGVKLISRNGFRNDIYDRIIS